MPVWYTGLSAAPREHGLIVPEKTMEWLLSKAAGLLIWALLISAGSGCQQQPAVDLAVDDPTPVSQQNQPADPANGGSSDAGEREKLVEESWFAYYIGEAKIGHGYNRVVSLQR